MEAAIAVFQHGAFSKAADALGTSQPAASMAVQRLERHLHMTIFERTGSGVRATVEGQAAIKAFMKITTIIEELKAASAANSSLKIGVTPLLSGRDVVSVLAGVLGDQKGGFDVEFTESGQLYGRQDLDIRVAVPSLQKKSTFCVELPTVWIGTDNGTLIVSRQEPEIWQSARTLLSNCDHPVRRVINVNDCCNAYHMALAGAGFTPCVMTPGLDVGQAVLDRLPPLPPTRLAVFAQYDWALRLKQVLSGNDD